MQSESLRELLTNPDATHAVPFSIQRRRKDANPELPRYDSDDAAANAALGRNADAIGPLAGIVVHPAGEHDTQQILNQRLLNCPLAGLWVEAPIGKRGPHDRQVAAAHERRALLEIELE